MEHLSDDLVAMLRDSIERYCGEHYDFQQRWQVLDDPAGYSQKAWSDFAELGWLALRLPESAGGIDADAATCSVLMETVGTRLLQEPVFASAVLASGLVRACASDRQKAELFPSLADGSLILAFAHTDTLNAQAEEDIECEYRNGRLYGCKHAVLHGDCAHQLIVSARNMDCGGRPVLLLVDVAAGVKREQYRLLDARGAASFYFDGVEGAILGEDADVDHSAVITQALDEASVALCSEAYGAICKLNTATLDYLKLRVQFGRPIGDYQVLQHRMVDLQILQHEARALLLAARAALSSPADERAFRISGARAFIASAARRVANDAVQMHGGIGVTDELDVSHYYRRLMVLGTVFGNRDYHLSRFAAAAVRLGESS